MRRDRDGRNNGRRRKGSYASGGIGGGCRYNGGGMYAVVSYFSSEFSFSELDGV